MLCKPWAMRTILGDVASVGAYPNSECYKWKLVP
uniref:Uncharacterized protein n=1 Tax=Vitis vinifera TaxID=29760 RepID=F6GW87_VITVI